MHWWRGFFSRELARLRRDGRASLLWSLRITVAATASYLVASRFFPEAQPLLAPLTAMLVVQVTPLIAGDPETAGPQAFEVTAGTVCFYVWDGSVGCELVRQILSAGLASWADHSGRIDRETRRMIQKLKRPNKRKR